MQYQYVFYLFSFGWVMGIVYDVYNTVTSSSRWLRWLRPILDLSFWCVSALTVYYLTFKTDNGRFRLYTFALLVIGYAVYRLILHHRVVSSAFAIMRLIQSFIQGIVAVINFLIVQPIRSLLKALWLLCVPLYRFFCKIEDLTVAVILFWWKVAVFPFQPMWRIWGKGWFEKFMDKWEGMYTFVSKWLRTWPQTNHDGPT